MKILSMTATFGKLSHQTLTLEPGLNVIHAPNEWGKSTWCAFLCAMLYGIDTRERTTQTTLADKERYAPWSGEPMSGKIALEWNGKKITLERRTKGRVPFGDFRAYETENGLPVPQLTAENCGEKLLGVEKTVFLRSAFIRQSQMPVSADEALRRRLNALVTTGDENDAADALAQSLRDLKNKCRHNRTGLLPQAEAERNAVTQKLAQLHALQEQVERLQQRQADLDSHIRLLENHQAALAYEASKADIQRVESAKQALKQASEVYEALEADCAQLPSRETAEETIVQLEQLRIQQEALQAEVLPPAPEKPETPGIFAGMTPEQALQQAKSDESAYRMLCKPVSPIMMILGMIAVAAGVVLALVNYLAAIPCGLFAVLFVVLHYRNKKTQKRDRTALLARYSGVEPEDWFATALRYSQQMAAYTQKETAYHAAAESLRSRKDALAENADQFTFGSSLSECLDGWRETLSCYDQLSRAREGYMQAKAHAETLASVVKPVAPPAQADTLHYAGEETERLLADATAEHRQLHLRLGQCMGQMETLGQEDALARQLEAIDVRISKLEDTYQALELAQKTLAEASEELQRRFAPRIAQRAQALFARLTGQRYDRLQLSQDLSVHAGAQGEDTLHTALWRSDGTADQLYLSLRLAVAEELTPHAPLVLDDAFVRFDDARLANALSVLQESAGQRQVILFTCQQREQTLLSK